MSTWLIPRAELTPEQIRAVELSPSEHRLILGGPGSGKTQILIHRAKHLADHFRTVPDRYRIFVFTKVLKHYIESAFPLLGLPAECVMTFDDWCLNWHRQHIGGRTPWNMEERHPDFPAIRRAVAERLVGQREALFDFVLVDEAQDLDEEVFRLLRQIAKHVTVCMDHKQQLYDSGSEEKAILQCLGVKRRNINLLEGFRCSPYLIRLAAAFIDDPDEKEAYINQARTAPRQKETPLLHYESGGDEMPRLADVIRERQMLGDRIAVLFPTNRKLHGFAKALRERGLDLETQPDVDFLSPKPKLLTYYSAKGLTFDSVLMPWLVLDHAWRRMETRSAKLLFVGITRATRWVYLSTNDTNPLPALSRLGKSITAGDLMVRRSKEAPANDQADSSRGRSDAKPHLDFL